MNVIGWREEPATLPPLAAAVLLPERSTLVAPGLPLPNVRGSDKPIARLTMTANDNDPIR